MNGPTMDCGGNVATYGSSSATSSAIVLAKRQAGHNPPAETAVRGAPHRGQGVEARAVAASLPPQEAGAARFGSEQEADLSRERAPDHVTKHVLLHGSVQQIGASEGDGYSIARSNADARIQEGGA